jgi:hypothetical protein
MLVHWQMALLKSWAESEGGSFLVHHKYACQMQFKDRIFEIKLNALDREFFILENGVIEKVVSSLSEIKMWYRYKFAI